MKDSDPRPAPPVPPRRLKRKNKPLVGPTDGVAEAAATSVIRLEPRPRLPPPPPPQRGFPRRGIRPLDIAGKILPGENCRSDSAIGDKLTANDTEEVEPRLSTFGTRIPLDRGIGKEPSAEEPKRGKRDKGKVPRPNEYPPLFFTLQDFQEVMSDVENSYSRTLKNMTSFEPTPKPRVSKIAANDLPETPEKGKVLFRVTTTNLPFEKSNSEWGYGGNDPNHFIFEDYVDRRQIVAQRKAKLVLFGDDTFDREDEDRTISTGHTASRVRFLVDSPTRDEHAEKITELDSLQDIDSLPLDSTAVQDSVPGEKSSRDKDEDEFGDVPFDSLINTADDPPSYVGVDPSEDSTSSRTDFQTILVTATVEPVPVVEGVEKPLGNSNLILKDEDVCVEPPSLCFETQGSDSGVKCDTERSSTPEFSEERDKGIGSIDRREEKRKLTVDESVSDFMEAGNHGDKSAPENVRRNSFLMNMLQGDEPDERVVCKVVAAHPKTPIHGSRIDGGRAGGEPNAAVEAKSKLLGELSSSFSAIRLKPVNNAEEEVEEKQSASDLKVDSMNARGGEGEGEEEAEEDQENKGAGDDDDEDEEAAADLEQELNRNLDSVLDSNVVKCKLSEEPIEDESRTPRNEPRHRSSVCSEKTDEIIDKNYVENVNSVCDEAGVKFVGDDGERDDKKRKKRVEEENEGKNYHSSINIKENNNNNVVVEVASRSSVDKCAIVLKCNNNNDNNAMTPVDVSYDQSPNNVSIIPGSVRSFVKFYEIQGETGVGLNSNDTAAVPKIKVEATGNYSDNINHRSVVPNTANCFAIENDIKYTIVARKPAVIKKPNDTVTLDEKLDKSSFDKSSGTEPRSMPVKFFETDRKRDDQFHAGSTMVRSTRVLQSKQEEAGTVRGRESRPKLSVRKKPDAVTSSSTRNAASGISRGTQNGSAAGVIKDVVRSGTTNHSVPKSSTSTINEQYTFYCTV